MDQAQVVFEYGKLQLNFVASQQQVAQLGTLLAEANKEKAALNETIRKLTEENLNLQKPLHCTWCGKETERHSRHILHNGCCGELLNAPRAADGSAVRPITFLEEGAERRSEVPEHNIRRIDEDRAESAGA